MPDNPVEGFGHELTQKGPGKIPVWGYAVGLAGAFLAFMYFRGSSSTPQNAPSGTGTAGTAPADTTTTTTISGGDGGPWQPPWRGWLTPPANPVPAPTTNDQWARLVSDWLISRGENPETVADAVDDYLHRQRVTGQEAAIVDMALTGWGNPPQGTFRVLRQDTDRASDREAKADREAEADRDRRAA